MKSLRLSLLLSFGIALAGCSTPAPISPREAFLSRVPDRKNYYKLYEVSPESLRWQEDRRLSLTKAITRGVHEAAKDCSDCPALKRHLSGVDYVADLLHEEQLEFLQRLEEVYDPKTDTILFFHYWIADDEDKVGEQEYGYLVTQGGIVKKRIVFGEAADE